MEKYDFVLFWVSVFEHEESDMVGFCFVWVSFLNMKNLIWLVSVIEHEESDMVGFRKSSRREKLLNEEFTT